MSNFELSKFTLFLLIIIGYISCKVGGLNERLPGGYYLHETSTEQIFISPKDYGTGTPIIPAEIIEVGWNNKAILAKQRKLPYQKSHYETTPGDFAYWILIPELKELYGPLELKEFQNKRIELGIPNNLILKNVNEFR